VERSIGAQISDEKGRFKNSSIKSLGEERKREVYIERREGRGINAKCARSVGLRVQTPYFRDPQINIYYLPPYVTNTGRLEA
jgi:hypothetical protein